MTVAAAAPVSKKLGGLSTAKLVAGMDEHPHGRPSLQLLQGMQADGVLEYDAATGLC
jgi:hypothetical protein